MEIIAHVHNAFVEKFGTPRQSGLVADVESRIVFTPDYRVPEALRGIEEYSHLWILWSFHQNKPKEWSPTIRPPRLGGNVRMGVFATRSPYRPNNIGLSCVRLLRVEHTKNEGAVLVIGGADMIDGTPVIDIKPYLPYADSYPEAKGGFGARHTEDQLNVTMDEPYRSMIPEDQRAIIMDLLRQDPRPHYHKDPERKYGMAYGDLNVLFTVDGASLKVCGVEKRNEPTITEET